MKKRKFLVITLVIITIILAVGAIYVGFILQGNSDVTPDDASAGTDEFQDIGASCCSAGEAGGGNASCVPGDAKDVSCADEDCSGNGQRDDRWCSYKIPSKYSCSGGHPSVASPNPREIDVCRGKLTGGNCQRCDSDNGQDECTVAGRNCDAPCHCFQPGDPGWLTCYEKGIGYDEGYFDGSYECKNIQSDVIEGGAGVWNCTSEDGRAYDECSPPVTTPPVTTPPVTTPPVTTPPVTTPPVTTPPVTTPPVTTPPVTTPPVTTPPVTTPPVTTPPVTTPPVVPPTTPPGVLPTSTPRPNECGSVCNINNPTCAPGNICMDVDTNPGSTEYRCVANICDIAGGNVQCIDYCAPSSLPNTAFDDSKQVLLMMGALLIVSGYIVYRNNIGERHIASLLGKIGANKEEKLVMKRKEL